MVFQALIYLKLDIILILHNGGQVGTVCMLPLRLKACSIDSILEVTLNKWNEGEKSFVFG